MNQNEGKSAAVRERNRQGEGASNPQSKRVARSEAAGGPNTQHNASPSQGEDALLQRKLDNLATLMDLLYEKEGGRAIAR